MGSAVVLIIAHKSALNPAEKASLAQCYKILGKHRIVLICPRGLDVSEYKRIYPDAEVDFVNSRWHSSYRMFNRLKIEPFIYKRFQEFRFILFYELDAWVFSDQLDYWCSLEYDFIGAPWFQGLAAATENSAFVGVGNGGFSLRKVSSHLKATSVFKYIKGPSELWRAFTAEPDLKKFFRLLTNISFRNNFHHLFNNYRRNEDIFWATVVAPRLGWKMPDLKTAARFSIEANARRMFALNDGQLPFGCHKWEKFDPEFWNQFIKI